MTEAQHALGPLAGRVALVTGASSGLGRATAVALAQAGADVALLARGRHDLEQVAAEVERAGRRGLVLVADLADAQALTGAVARVVEALGRVDVLVNAAGTDVPAPVAELAVQDFDRVVAADLADAQALTGAVARVVEELGRVDVLVNAAGTDVPAPVTELAVQDFDRVLAVNLRAPFVLAKAVFPHMRAAGGGTIVNVSSVAGKRGWANASAYCASKFGLTGLTQALAAEGRGHGIRACVLYPGAMATSWGVWSPAERERAQEERPPARTALPPQEVAALVVWLVAAPAELVVNEAIVSPLEEQGWP